MFFVVIRSSVTSGGEEVIVGLKAELERCLVIYRSKRQQVLQLSAELKLTKSQLVDATSQLDATRTNVRETNVS